MRIRLQQAARLAAGARRRVFPALPIRLPGAGCAMRGIAVPKTHYHSRHRPQRRTARAAGRIRFAAAGIQPAAHGKLSGYARLPPRGVSPLLTSPCPARCTGRFGRSPYFATSASSRRSPRPRGGTRRMNSLYQPSVTVGVRFRPNVPVGAVPADADFRACNSLLLYFQGKQHAPGASKITVYRLQPAHAARSSDFPELLAVRSTVARALGKLYSE